MLSVIFISNWIVMVMFSSYFSTKSISWLIAQGRWETGGVLPTLRRQFTDMSRSMHNSN